MIEKHACGFTRVDVSRCTMPCPVLVFSRCVCHMLMTHLVPEIFLRRRREQRAWHEGRFACRWMVLLSLSDIADICAFIQSHSSRATRPPCSFAMGFYNWLQQPGVFYLVAGAHLATWMAALSGFLPAWLFVLLLGFGRLWLCDFYCGSCCGSMEALLSTIGGRLPALHFVWRCDPGGADVDAAAVLATFFLRALWAKA